MKKSYVIDTSVLLTNYNSIHQFSNNDIVIPFKVLEEIDKHKQRQDGVGSNARMIIRILDRLRNKGNLHNGVRPAKGKGLISIKQYDRDCIDNNLDLANADNQIIATAITEKQRVGRRKVIVVTRDINMRVKCDALGIPTEDYVSDQVVNDTTELYTGFVNHLVDEQIIDQFYNSEDVFLEKEDIKLFANQFVMLVSSSNNKKTALAKFVSYSSPLKRVPEYKNGIWGLKPRNKEQMFSINLLLDPEVPIVTIIGKAGCGKTLVALAAGLEQVIEKDTYKKLVVSRPVQPVGKDIGFLPGTLEEKMKPWIMPIQDNLDFLMNGTKDSMSMYFEDGTIEIEALTYIRGRSISNAFIIIDEAQNLTVHELKTIVTRVGEGTKIVLTGDIEQIDNTYLDSTSNGLSYAIEKFKTHDLSGHVSLSKGERSKVATLAAKIL
jgi:PhoH-like ATPase